MQKLSLLFTLGLLAIVSSAKAETLKVLTFNTWLLEAPVVGIDLAKLNNARLILMPEKFEESGADIIFLQEVWKKKYRRFLVKAMKAKGWNVCIKQRKGIFKLGNGLMIFSKLPIKSCHSHVFRYITRGDEKFVRKGILEATVYHEQLGNTLLVNSHFGALSFDFNNWNYVEHQFLNHRKQVDDFVQVIKKESRQEFDEIIIGMDFNIHDRQHQVGEDRYSEELNPTYEMFINDLNLLDTYREIHTYGADEENFNGLTYSSRNSFSRTQNNSGFLSDERLDYIMISRDSKLLTIDSKIVFDEKYLTRRGNETFLSDHFGLLTEFSF